MLLSDADSNCKSLVVFDCCREDLKGARARVSKAFEKIENKEVQLDDKAEQE